MTPREGGTAAAGHTKLYLYLYNNAKGTGGHTEFIYGLPSLFPSSLPVARSGFHTSGAQIHFRPLYTLNCLRGS
jgi:hypothetical protein